MRFMTVCGCVEGGTSAGKRFAPSTKTHYVQPPKLRRKCAETPVSAKYIQLIRQVASPAIYQRIYLRACHLICLQNQLQIHPPKNRPIIQPINLRAYLRPCHLICLQNQLQIHPPKDRLRTRPTTPRTYLRPCHLICLQNQLQIHLPNHLL